MKILVFVAIVVCLPYLCHCNVDGGSNMTTGEPMDCCDNCNQTCKEKPNELCTPGSGDNVGLAFGLTIGAGFATNIGALLSFLPCFKRSNITLLAIGLSLAAGFMVYISFVEILGKAGDYFHCHTEEHASLAATGCFFLGIVITLLLQFFLDSIQRLDIGCRPPWSKKRPKTADQEEYDTKKESSSVMKSLKSKLMGRRSDCDKEEKIVGAPNVNITTEGKSSDETKFDSTSAGSEIVVMADENTADEKPDEIPPVDSENYEEVMDLLGQEAKDLHRMGLFTAAAIGIHNFPEGIATFIVGLATPELGIALAIAVAVHNIPEGASVAIPIYYATGSKWKGLLWAFLSGISEPIGALLAFLIFKDIFGPLAYGFLFGLVGGMMVIVAMKDLLPTARKFDKHGMVVTSFFILGMFIMAASLIMFGYSE